VREREVRDRFAGVHTPQGVERRYELTDLDGERVGVSLHGRGWISVFSRWPRDGESAAVAARHASSPSTIAAVSPRLATENPVATAAGRVKWPS
jgi:hypothetical protein